MESFFLYMPYPSYSLPLNPAFKLSAVWCRLFTFLPCILMNPLLGRIVGRGSKLIGCGSAVPKRVLSNDELSKIVDTNDEWISVRTGIRNRRVLSGMWIVCIVRAHHFYMHIYSQQRYLRSDCEDMQWHSLKSRLDFSCMHFLSLKGCSCIFWPFVCELATLPHTKSLCLFGEIFIL